MNEIDNESVIIDVLGEQEGSYFNDKVWVALSPAWLQNLNAIFIKKALSNKNYVDQGFDRKQADFFDYAYKTWRNARNKFDKKDHDEKDNIAESLSLTVELFECIASEAMGCSGRCIESSAIRIMDKDVYICPYLRLKKGD